MWLQMSMLETDEGPSLLRLSFWISTLLHELNSQCTLLVLGALLC